MRATSYVVTTIIVGNSYIEIREGGGGVGEVEKGDNNNPEILHVIYNKIVYYESAKLLVATMSIPNYESVGFPINQYMCIFP